MFVAGDGGCQRGDSRADELEELVGRLRFGDEVSLGVAAPDVGEHLELGGCLDAFGDDAQVECAGHGVDGFDEGAVAGVTVVVANHARRLNVVFSKSVW
jgi:hypothetical protein